MPVSDMRGPMADVLIVEDDADSVALLSLYLREFACAVRVVGDGAQALESIQTHPPDLILLDIMLPGLDGYEVASRVRADPALKDIPIVACTARAMAEDRARALAAGCTVYLAKPVGLRDFRQVVSAYLTRQPGPPAADR